MLGPWFPSPCMYSRWTEALPHTGFSDGLGSERGSDMNHNIDCTLYRNMKSLKTFHRSNFSLPRTTCPLAPRGALLKLLWQETWKGQTRNFSRFASFYSWIQFKIRSLAGNYEIIIIEKWQCVIDWDAISSTFYDPSLISVGLHLSCHRSFKGQMRQVKSPSALAQEASKSLNP